VAGQNAQNALIVEINTMPSTPLIPLEEVPWKQLGFRRAAVVVPELKLADPSGNLAIHKSLANDLSASGVDLAVFPELSLTGYSCGDLFFHHALLDSSELALQEFAAATRGSGTIWIVGLPVRQESRLFNCAAVLQGGEILGVVPKIHLPNSAEFYEARWFASGAEATSGRVFLGGQEVPFGTDLIFAEPEETGLRIGVEICEDLWSVQPPSGFLALAGANVLVNLSASTEILQKASYRRDLVVQQSARCLAAYLYTSSGPGESSSDVVYSGHALISENGHLLGESERFNFQSQWVSRDLDLSYLTSQRNRNSSYAHDRSRGAATLRRIPLAKPRNLTLPQGLIRSISPMPFVPRDESKRQEACREILAIQSTGLARRLLHTGSKRAVIGISGGLDSTLALLVCLEAFRRAKLDISGILGVCMPGPGTTDRTLENARQLLASLQVESREIPITAAVQQHLGDIAHPDGVHDVTFENAQARERTQILMDLANQQKALVVGTGDLSEAALGWATFNGDHMSMYHVNSGVPKTLVRYVIEWFATTEAGIPLASVLQDVCATPITPELLPKGAQGELLQHTETLVGPYELHDFFLYHSVYCGFSPNRVEALARVAFAGQYSGEEIRRWLGVFIRRFFAQQFKRNSMPDGPKVGTVALSPRGDLRMPPDALSRTWEAFA
jgi:NAD+ synthase (glutamine-hydrolysing)